MERLTPTMSDDRESLRDSGRSRSSVDLRRSPVNLRRSLVDLRTCDQADDVSEISVNRRSRTPDSKKYDLSSSESFSWSKYSYPSKVRSKTCTPTPHVEPKEELEPEVITKPEFEPKNVSSHYSPNRFSKCTRPDTQNRWQSPVIERMQKEIVASTNSEDCIINLINENKLKSDHLKMIESMMDSKDIVYEHEKENEQNDIDEKREDIKVEGLLEDETEFKVEEQDGTSSAIEYGRDDADSKYACGDANLHKPEIAYDEVAVKSEEPVDECAFTAEDTYQSPMPDFAKLFADFVQEYKNVEGDTELGLDSSDCEPGTKKDDALAVCGNDEDNVKPSNSSSQCAGRMGEVGEIIGEQIQNYLDLRHVDVNDEYENKKNDPGMILDNIEKECIDEEVMAHPALAISKEVSEPASPGSECLETEETYEVLKNKIQNGLDLSYVEYENKDTSLGTIVDKIEKRCTDEEIVTHSALGTSKEICSSEPAGSGRECLETEEENIVKEIKIQNCLDLRYVEFENKDTSLDTLLDKTEKRCTDVEIEAHTALAISKEGNVSEPAGSGRECLKTEIEYKGIENKIQNGLDLRYVEFENKYAALDTIVDKTEKRCIDEGIVTHPALGTSKEICFSELAGSGRECLENRVKESKLQNGLDLRYVESENKDAALETLLDKTEKKCTDEEIVTHSALAISKEVSVSEPAGSGRECLKTEIGCTGTENKIQNEFENKYAALDTIVDKTEKRCTDEEIVTHPALAISKEKCFSEPAGSGRECLETEEKNSVKENNLQNGLELRYVESENKDAALETLLDKTEKKCTDEEIVTHSVLAISKEVNNEGSVSEPAGSGRECPKTEIEYTGTENKIPNGLDLRYVESSENKDTALDTILDKTEKRCTNEEIVAHSALAVNNEGSVSEPAGSGRECLETEEEYKVIENKIQNGLDLRYVESENKYAAIDTLLDKTEKRCTDEEIEAHSALAVCKEGSVSEPAGSGRKCLEWQEESKSRENSVRSESTEGSESKGGSSVVSLVSIESCYILKSKLELDSTQDIDEELKAKEVERKNMLMIMNYEEEAESPGDSSRAKTSTSELSCKSPNTGRRSKQKVKKSASKEKLAANYSEEIQKLKRGFDAHLRKRELYDKKIEQREQDIKEQQKELEELLKCVKTEKLEVEESAGKFTNMKKRWKNFQDEATRSRLYTIEGELRADLISADNSELKGTIGEIIDLKNEVKERRKIGLKELLDDAEEMKIATEYLREKNEEIELEVREKVDKFNDLRINALDERFAYMDVREKLTHAPDNVNECLEIEPEIAEQDNCSFDGSSPNNIDVELADVDRSETGRETDRQTELEELFEKACTEGIFSCVNSSIGSEACICNDEKEYSESENVVDSVAYTGLCTEKEVNEDIDAVYTSEEMKRINESQNEFESGERKQALTSAQQENTCERHRKKSRIPTPIKMDIKSPRDDHDTEKISESRKSTPNSGRAIVLSPKVPQNIESEIAEQDNCPFAGSAPNNLDVELADVDRSETGRETDRQTELEELFEKACTEGIFSCVNSSIGSEACICNDEKEYSESENVVDSVAYTGLCTEKEVNEDIDAVYTSEEMTRINESQDEIESGERKQALTSAQQGNTWERHRKKSRIPTPIKMDIKSPRDDHDTEKISELRNSTPNSGRAIVLSPKGPRNIESSKGNVEIERKKKYIKPKIDTGLNRKNNRTVQVNEKLEPSTRKLNRKDRPIIKGGKRMKSAKSKEIELPPLKNVSNRTYDPDVMTKSSDLYQPVAENNQLLQRPFGKQNNPSTKVKNVERPRWNTSSKIVRDDHFPHSPKSPRPVRQKSPSLKAKQDCSQTKNKTIRSKELPPLKSSPRSLNDIELHNGSRLLHERNPCITAKKPLPDIKREVNNYSCQKTPRKDETTHRLSRNIKPLPPIAGSKKHNSELSVDGKSHILKKQKRPLPPIVKTTNTHAQKPKEVPKRELAKVAMPPSLPTDGDQNRFLDRA